MTAVFQFSIFGMTCLASIMLAMAERSPLAGVSVPLVIIALFFTERWKVLVLSTFGANALGMLAFLATAAEFFLRPTEVRLLAGAHLLVYLTWIVLFQQKTSRHYWAMCALGILQVALGAVLTAGWSFGVLLIIYMFLAIWTLSVFSLLQAQQRFDKTEQFAQASDSKSSGLLSFTARRAPVPAFPTSGSDTNGFAMLVQSNSMSRGTVQQDPQAQSINTRFFVGVFFSVCMSITIGLISFALIPRLWFGQWSIFPSSTPPANQTLTGFTEEVHLGDIGEILESTETVLEVRIFDNDTGEELDIQDYVESLGFEEPLFRGTVLGEYTKGRWVTRITEGKYDDIADEPKRGMIRQEIRMQPIGTPILFAVHPVESCRIDHSLPDTGLNNVTSVLIRNNRISSADMLSYSAYAWKRRLRPGQQVSVPGVPPTHPSAKHAFIDYSSMPTRGLDRLKQLAREKSGIDSPDGPPPKVVMARQLESFLRDSGEFTYSLNASIHDASIDPVEDFLFNRKQGHCEYYASALALMLRAVEIPSRLVSGFKGGDKDKYTGLFVVQHRHAHSWVEAYIDNRWVVFDAIPAGRQRSVDSIAQDISAWKALEQAATMLWSQNVTGMTLSKQRSLFYRPIRDRANRIVEAVRRRYEAAAESLGPKFGSRDFWFTGQGYAIAFALLSVLAVLLWLCCWLIKKAILHGRKLRWGFRRIDDDSALRVEFYERFLRILSALGLSRKQTQTQREFSLDVEQELSALLSQSGLIDVPLELAEQFYRVRFGALPLRDDEIRKLDASLTRFEECLNAAPK